MKGPRTAAVIAVVALVCGFALSLVAAQHVWASRPAAQRDSDQRADLTGKHDQDDLAAEPLSACEKRLERQPSRLPVVAVVGASYTAGVGPNNPRLSWAVELARLLHWNAVIYGVPGAGYLNHGASERGPMERMLVDERLRLLSPSLVIVQAGHDDLGLPSAQETLRVRADVTLIRHSAVRARVALLTVFADPRGGNAPGARATDRAIVAGGRAADSRVIIMDPLAGRWKFARVDHGAGLHPTAAGDAWIARKVLSVLRGHGITTALGAATAPMICDVAVGVGKQAAAA